MPEMVQIVPHLPPALGGVAGYALALARGLRDHTGVATRFLVTDPAAPVEEGGEEGISVHRLEHPEASRLRRALDELVKDGGNPVLLHYANYAYGRRGCPYWLVSGLERWKETRGARLLTFFHEVYAGGPPWRSSFWLGPVQRRLAARLARRSDRVATSLPLYAGLLEKIAPGAGAVVLPVLSPLGEPASPPPLADRFPRRLVVFGGPGARRKAYGQNGRDLAAACRSLDIAEVLDGGAPLPPGPPLPHEVGGVPLRALGPLSDAAASDLLGGAFAGFVAHAPDFLGKSTIFAACCAHGVLPVCPGDAGGIAWRPGDPAGPRELQAVATAARSWYLQHSAPRLAAVFHQMLFA